MVTTRGADLAISAVRDREAVRSGATNVEPVQGALARPPAHADLILFTAFTCRNEYVSSMRFLGEAPSATPTKRHGRPALSVFRVVGTAVPRSQERPQPRLSSAAIALRARR